MTQQLTLTEAIAHKDDVLADVLARTTEWDRGLVEQAVRWFGADGRLFSANDLREWLPEMAHGHIGAVIRGLAQRRPPVIVPVSQTRSTSAATHGKEIRVYRLANHRKGNRA